LLRGAFRCWMLLWLGDGLEAAVVESNRVRSIDRNTRAHDLGDKVVTGACDPNVASLIDGDGLVGVQVACGLLITA
jgi:hypothetical protein